MSSGKIRWSKEEDEILLKLLNEGKSYKDIAKLLNRSRKAVSIRYNRIMNGCGAERRKGRWEDDEINFLRENYKKLSIRKMANILNRSYRGVSRKLKEILSDTSIIKRKRKERGSICFDCGRALQCVWVFLGKQIWEEKKEDGTIVKCRYFVPDKEGNFGDYYSGIIAGEREDTESREEV